MVTECEFFERCPGAGMKEELRKEVEFPGDSCEAFDRFFLWIYSSQAPDLDSGSGDEALAAMKARVLADKFCMEDWKNALIDSMMLEWQACTIQIRRFEWLYTNTEADSQLHQLGVEQLVWQIANTPRIRFDEGWYRILTNCWPRPTIQQQI